MRYCFLVIVINLIGCTQQKNNTSNVAKFDDGEITVYSKTRESAQGYELTLVSRFEFKKKGFNNQMSNYFQYKLGQNINLMIDNDTLRPSLFYYVPIINENQKEIDCKYVLDQNSIKKNKYVIFGDNILGLNKIKILLK